ncbi:hypothetical protein K5Q29_02720 [Streptococcus sp. 2018037]|uniref:hypothetical protein n=1 Tax=Streptococcus sp. 2018037 TaxID=2870782 RepID=UPI001C8EB58B|nr:hypothetical protein [Streptococcus sp. 2018037]MBY0752364.1 hypothetical protein [Streptococcus sp. 2018037]
MRKIHHYFKETLQKELVEKLIRLDFVEYVEDSSKYVRNEELVKYFKEKESELERRVGRHRYRVEFPEYSIRTFEECVWLLQELDQCFKRVHHLFETKQME